MEAHAVKESFVEFRTNQGVELRARFVRLTRHQIVFELYNPHATLRLSEALGDFGITIQDRLCYSGKGIIRNLLSVGQTIVCDVTLQESGWMDVDMELLARNHSAVARQFQNFVQEWTKSHRVAADYKVMVSDMHDYFSELRLWCEQVELGIRNLVATDRERVEAELADELSQAAMPMLNSLFEQFEPIASKLDADQIPPHASYMKRHLHPLVMPAPFAYRTFHKPLGYAGDYEMVNMITRDAFEGASLYAKVINRWFLRRPPAAAHRNRLVYLAQKLTEETARIARSNRRAKIFNLGCGPAHEIQTFLANQELSSYADFTLLDFNEETLECARAGLTAHNQQNHRNARLQFVKESVYHLLKEATKGTEASRSDNYDLAYCAGLFDYLSDQVCGRLANILFEKLSPGGLLIITNVEPANPSRYGMEHLLDWHLNYRLARDFAALKPRCPLADETRVFADDTGVNLFLEVRKRAYA